MPTSETRRWLAAQGREDEFVAAGGRSRRDLRRASSRSTWLTLQPLVALPPSPGNVVPVAEVAGTAVVQVCVGSSVNSSYEDLAIVAAVLREPHACAPGVG